MIKTILVPTDGSDHANKAAILAADIAQKYGARLVLLHVMAHGPLPEAWRHMAEVEHLVTPAAAAGADIPSAGIPTTKPLWRRAASNEDREVLEFIGRKVLSAAEEIARDKGVRNCATALEEGNPVKRILDRADKEDANLIVMGSRGLSDLNGLLMGSVSRKISHLAKCTCIMVK